MGWVPPSFICAIEELKPPVLASNRLEEVLDREPVVGLPRDVFAN
jgi:hypothetical protein